MKYVIKTNTFRLLLSVILLCNISAVHAKDIWYQVEVIVFENLQGDADGEAWPVTPGYPDTDLAIDFFAEEDTVQLNGELAVDNRQAEPVEQQSAELTESDPEAVEPAPPVVYEQLPAEAFRIANVFSRMKRSARYRPLIHLAWYQSGDEDVPSQAVRVMLNSDEDPDSITNQQILDGTVKMRKSRFIHMEADLAYFLPVSMATESEDQTYASLVRLRESRKMRLNELHYLDHPLFGVVVYVSPMQID